MQRKVSKLVYMLFVQMLSPPGGIPPPGNRTAAQGVNFKREADCGTSSFEIK